MQSINFEIGNYKEYAINGDENNTIKIDMSDIGLIDRMKNAIKEIADYQKELSKVENPDESILTNADKKAREIINKALDSNVCSKAFGNKNCLSIAVNGKMLIENFVEALIPIIEKDFANECRIKEKTDKYIQPVIEQPAPPIAGMNPQPSVDISNLTQEQKDTMLSEMLRQSK